MQGVKGIGRAIDASGASALVHAIEETVRIVGPMHPWIDQAYGLTKTGSGESNESRAGTGGHYAMDCFSLEMDMGQHAEDAERAFDEYLDCIAAAGDPAAPECKHFYDEAAAEVSAIEEGSSAWNSKGCYCVLNPRDARCLRS